MSNCAPGSWAAEYWAGKWRVIDHNDIAVASITRDSEENAKLIAAAPEMLADLVEAAKTLRRYEVLHRAKGTDESTAKADVNAALASRFELTIAKAKGE